METSLRAVCLSAVLLAALSRLQFGRIPHRRPANRASRAANVTAKRLANAASEPSQWMTYGGNYEEQRFSGLKQIDKSNVKHLGLAWFADYDTNLQQAGTPLYIDGVIYVSTAWSKVYAYDAKTGKQLWQYNPKTPGEWIQNVCCGIVNRGIAAWNGKIYLGTLEGSSSPSTRRPARKRGRCSPIDPKGTTPSPARRASPRARCSSAIPAASSACAATSARTTPRPASWSGASTPSRAIRHDGFENEAMKKAAATWGRRVVEARRRRHGVGRHRLRPRDELLYFGTGNGTPWNQSARDPSHRRQPVSRVDHRGEGRHRRIRLALPDDAAGHVGLRRRQPDDGRESRNSMARSATCSCSRARTASSTCSMLRAASCCSPSRSRR